MKYKEISFCPLCESEKWSTQYALSIPIVRCRNCNLIFAQIQPEIQPSQFYQESYYRGSSSQKTNLENENVLAAERIARRLESCRGITEMITRYLPKPGKWLDIGCGPGFLLYAASQSGWQCTGLEPSPFASAYARENFGLTDIHNAGIENAGFPSSCFDVITMQHVIEHFGDPLNTMKETVRWLKPGGLLYLETPDIASSLARKQGEKWEHLKLPEHLFYFSESTLRLLLKKLKCEILLVRHPVESTGLMNKVCGGEKKAAHFYDRFRHFPLFQKAVNAVRGLNEIFRSRMKGESDIIHVLARKSGQTM